MVKQTLFLFFLTLLSSYSLMAQKGSIVTVKGYAPSYVGQTVSIAAIEDYLSMNEAPLASTTVSSDSTFSVSFFITETQKVIVHPGKNKSYLYIQSNSTYDLYLPEKDRYEPYRPSGNSIEVTFFDLDSNDINFKILQFQRWMDGFISDSYYLKNTKPLEFAAKLDEFKTNAEKQYVADTNTYFKTFVKFSIASLDNIQNAAERNRYEKHDFYIKPSIVAYKNDAYMGYISAFYEKMVPRLSAETNTKVYQALLKSSPTLIMRALGTEYTLINMRIREIVMIKALSEEFYSKDFPQTNILTVLDSVANHSLFESNAIIARNMSNRLTQLVAGGKAPEFVLKNDKSETKVLTNYSKKYVYLHFYDPTSQKSEIEVPPLIDMYKNYKEDVTFITIYPDTISASVQSSSFLKSIPWEKCAVSSSNPIWKNYRIESFPSYVLIDGYGYIVEAPALGPLPDGQYQTIDRTFFYIQKVNKEMQEH